jgi:hypothetical protein
MYFMVGTFQASVILSQCRKRVVAGGKGAPLINQETKKFPYSIRALKNPQARARVLHEIAQG